MTSSNNFKTKGTVGIVNSFLMKPYEFVKVNTSFTSKLPTWGTLSSTQALLVIWTGTGYRPTTASGLFRI